MSHAREPRVRPLAGFRGNFTPPRPYFFARSHRPAPRGRRNGSLPKRSSLARLDFVLRILPWRQRCWPRRQPSDRLDRPCRKTPRAKRGIIMSSLEFREAIPGDEAVLLPMMRTLAKQDPEVVPFDESASRAAFHQFL